MFSLHLLETRNQDGEERDVNSQNSTTCVKELEKLAAAAVIKMFKQLKYNIHNISEKN